MPSESLRQWSQAAYSAFDELESAHRAVGGVGPGRRVATQQINYAYVTLLAARFQGFARALHTQTADVIATGVSDKAYELILREAFTRDRALDKHNAQPNSIAADYGRFGFDVWQALEADRPGNDVRRRKLWRIVEWRNAIAHHDIDERLAVGSLEPTSIKLGVCKRWRRALNVLAGSLDRVAADQCEAVGLARPW